MMGILFGKKKKETDFAYVFHDWFYLKTKIKNKCCSIKMTIRA